MQHSLPAQPHLACAERWYQEIPRLLAVFRVWNRGLTAFYPPGQCRMCLGVGSLLGMGNFTMTTTHAPQRWFAFGSNITPNMYN